MALHLRPISLAAGLVLTGLALAGCSSSLLAGEPTPDLTTADVVYLNELRHADYEINTPASATGLITTAQDTCTDLGKGTTVAAAAKKLAATVGPGHASVTVVAAIDAYCPQHGPLLTIPPR